MDSSDWLSYGALAALLCASAFFSSIETAFSAVNMIRMKNAAEDGEKKAQAVVKVNRHYDKILSTVLVGNNIVNIGAASLATVLATKAFGAAGAAVSTVVMTILVLIFGELLPKNYGKEHADKYALGVANFLLFLMWAMTPITAPFIRLVRAVSGKRDEEDRPPSVTEEELKYIIETIEEEGVLDEQESELVQSALEFGDITAQEILTPRVDLVALDIADDRQTIIDTVLEEKYSRMPVYEKTVDNLIGVVKARDVLEAAMKDKVLNLRAIMTPCMFIHKTMRLSSLLGEFKRTKNHIAVVTDDYGGTLGIVTMEDVLEQLVGEIWDEDDEIEQDILMLDDGRFEVTGDMGISQFFEIIDYDNKHFESDYNTLGGWTLEKLHHIPEPGESFESDGLQVTVAGVSDNRITKLVIQRMEEQE